MTDEETEVVAEEIAKLVRVPWLQAMRPLL